MDKISNLFQTNEVFRRDLFVGFGIWLSLLVIGFVLLPGIGLVQPEARFDGWMLMSLLGGIIGVFLLALSPRLIERDRQRSRRVSRWSWVLVWRLLAWVGLAGLASPLLMISYEIFTTIFNQILSGT
ncbi:hypothetical protein [Vacuolonema iberomarrocanum]|uniref:hypothetical protein n=1 Tax=Vacuolonema iberomarrocanum TaxID=3454632 RepID=UPI001A030CA6|nr:hypothetical protein [filamentous cyanobacterium LEGE 07170]